MKREDKYSCIVGSGAKRMKHGSYACVYRDNRGNGKYAFRGDIQRVDATGVHRLRRWFNSYEAALRWVKGNDRK